MKLLSPQFQDNENIPVIYTCDGEGINPPLVISDVPEQAKSLILICTDPDSPSGDFIHWILWNIDPNISEIKENSIPYNVVEGLTSIGKPGFVGPCPNSGKHHYIFTIFALDLKLNLNSTSDISMLKNTIQNHILEQTELIGLYQRNK